MAKNSIYKNLILNDDEGVIRIIRQSWLKLAFNLILPVLLIMLPFFFLYPLFSFGNKGILVFSLTLVVGILLLLRNIIIWSWRTFIITNQRIIDIDQQGIFKKTVSDIPLAKIQDVYYQIKGIWQTLTRIGDINVILLDNKTKIEIKNIPKPHKTQQLILQLKADTFKEKLDSTNLSAQELVNLVKKIKAGLGEEKFNEIIKESGAEKEKIIEDN